MDKDKEQEDKPKKQKKGKTTSGFMDAKGPGSKKDPKEKGSKAKESKKSKDKEEEKEKEEKPQASEAEKKQLYMEQLANATLCIGNVWIASLKPGANIRPARPKACQEIKASILRSGYSSSINRVVVHENSIYDVALGRRRCSNSKRTNDY